MSEVNMREGGTHAPTFMRRMRRRNEPSVRTDKSWKRKKMPGLRCSSSRRHALADNGPTSVRVYVWRGSGSAGPAAAALSTGTGEPGGGGCAYGGYGTAGWVY